MYVNGLPEDVAVLYSMGYQTLQHRYSTQVRYQNEFSHNVMVCCVKG